MQAINSEVLFLFKPILNMQLEVKHSPTASPIKSILSPTAAWTVSHILPASQHEVFLFLFPGTEESRRQELHTEAKWNSLQRNQREKQLCFICLLSVSTTAQGPEQITLASPQGSHAQLSHSFRKPVLYKRSCQSMLSLIDCCLMVSQLLPWELSAGAKTQVYNRDQNM